MRDWRRFWSAQDAPLHHDDSAIFYSKHALELSILIGNVAGRRVLELGCGNGALFRLLGFHRASRYVGIDFSKRMLAQFQRYHPAATLICSDATVPQVEGPFELVFSNGLAQYLTKTQFIRHLRSVKSLLSSDGKYVCGSLPGRERWLSYVLGQGMFPPEFRLLSAVKEAANRSLGRSALGTWFSLAYLERAARSAELRLQVYGSVCYLYRYHVIFACKSSRTSLSSASTTQPECG